MYTITLIPGDGVGPEISEAVKAILAAAKVPIQWETYEAGQSAQVKYGELLPGEVLDSIIRNRIALKDRNKFISTRIITTTISPIYLPD